MLNVRKKLKGKNKLETYENYSIASIVFGSFILSLGIGSTIITPKGIPAILSMMGALWSFLSTVALVVVWVVQEMKGKE